MKYDYLDYEQIKKMGERIKISRKCVKQNKMQKILFFIYLYNIKSKNRFEF